MKLTVQVNRLILWLEQWPNSHLSSASLSDINEREMIPTNNHTCWFNSHFQLNLSYLVAPEFCSFAWTKRFIFWFAFVPPLEPKDDFFMINTHTHNRFTAIFPGPPRWAGGRRELLDFMVQGKITRGRHTDHPAGCHSVWSNQYPPPPSPIFLQAGCPACRLTNSVKALKVILMIKGTIFYGPDSLSAVDQLNWSQSTDASQQKRPAGFIVSLKRIYIVQDVTSKWDV